MFKLCKPRLSYQLMSHVKYIIFLTTRHPSVIHQNDKLWHKTEENIFVYIAANDINLHLKR